MRVFGAGHGGRLKVKGGQMNPRRSAADGD